MTSINLGDHMEQNNWYIILNHRLVSIHSNLFLEFHLRASKEEELKIHIPLKDIPDYANINLKSFHFLNFYRFDYKLKQFELIVSPVIKKQNQMNPESLLYDPDIVEILTDEKVQIKLTCKLYI